jgi:RimJ/RimL family protein N-acetyltransferase
MAPVDLDFIAGMLANPDVMEFFERTYSRDEAAAWIEKQQARYATDGHGYWIAEDGKSKQPIGQAGLLKIELDGVDEIGLGYLIHRPFWGRGLATEAAAACRDYAFGHLAAARLVCPIRPENRASQRVALRIGMKPGRLTVFAGFEHLIFSMQRLG